MKNLPKLFVKCIAILFCTFAIAAPEGYILAGTSSDGTSWFIHPDVSLRGMKVNANDINVIADIWTQPRYGDGSGYKEAFKCNEPGATFSVIPSGDGGLSNHPPAKPGAFKL